MGKYGLKLCLSQGIEYFVSPKLMKDHSIRVLFTLRAGGFSKIPFDSLNLASHVGDDLKDVIRNRMKVADVFSLNPSKMTFCEQVHGSEVRSLPCLGDDIIMDECGQTVAATDALVTGSKDLPIIVLTADCVPIILVEPKRRVISVVHAGWKGSLSEITKRACGEMVSSFGLAPAKILAFFGPAISGSCYEVSKELHDEFVTKFSLDPDHQGGRRHLDLEYINILQLLMAGIGPENVYSARTCTVSDLRCFSYRREGGKTGRMAAIAVLT
ncbi:MAG: peptidoglycan editing factor PgeF [Actinomycetota bacterium]|nr:peptidoglycan editing factor PgeF [Actinomycetota bacterium]